MLTQVEISSVSRTLTALELPIINASGSDIQVRNIEGLGPVKAEINTSQYSGFRGGVYLGSQIGMRNIVITVGLNPNWFDKTMASLRTLLYQYLMTGLGVRMVMRCDHIPDTEIFGRVESLEPMMFSKDPEVQISILCPDPDFVSLDEEVVTGVVDDWGVNGSSLTFADVPYLGTVETGIELDVKTSSTRPSYTGRFFFSMGNEGAESFIRFETTVDATKFIYLNSKVKEKNLASVLVSDSAQTKLFSEVTHFTGWPLLYPGVNSFNVAADDYGQAWTLTYKNRFGAI